MNILITGMQRSGTTLLRRIFTVHPQVKRIFHESFFLTKFKTAKILRNHLINARGINPKKHIWGEKCPYFPNIRRVKVEEYCRILHEWHPQKFRCVHVVRHPFDVANSNVAKFKYVKSVQKPITMYEGIVPRIVKALNDMPYVIQIKYENLLLEPDIVIPKIYEFCNLDPNVDYRKKLKKLPNKRYQKIDPSRAFAYKKQNVNWNYDLEDAIKIVNEVDGVKYEIKRG